jgi:hypothetical protein
MTEAEFREKAKEYGYTEEEIAEEIEIYREARKAGINMPLDLGLTQKPIE